MGILNYLRIWKTPRTAEEKTISPKKYALRKEEIRPLLIDWDGPPGCIATDHITVLGKKVGYCYREKTSGAYPDSGWRFFSGEETDEYLNDPKNSGVYLLNTICNYDAAIIPLLSAPYGSAFGRGEDGKFYEE